MTPVLARTPEWYAARRLGIGSSEVAALFGADPYLDEQTLFARKMTGSEALETEEMRMGTLLEDFILARYNERAAPELAIPLQVRTPDPEAPHLFSTPDAGHVSGPIDTVVELKATSHEPFDARGAWLRWILQVQVQLAGTGARHGRIAVLHQSVRFRVYEVARNDALIDAIRERVESWWWRYPRRGEMPPPSPPSHEALDMLYPVDDGSVVELPAEALEWDARIAELAADAKRAERHADEYRAWIKQAIGEARAGRLPGGGSWQWSTIERPAYWVPAKTIRELRRRKR